MELEGTVGMSVVTEVGLAVSEVLTGQRVANGAGPGCGWAGTRWDEGWGAENQSQGTGLWREHHVVKHPVGFEVEKDRSVRWDSEQSIVAILEFGEGAMRSDSLPSFAELV